MKRVLPAVLLLAVMSLSACHTDPFSMKPDVRGVRIPEKPAQAPDEESSAPTDQEQR